MTADALALCASGSAAAKVLIIHNKRMFVFHEVGLKYLRYIKHIFSCFLK